jgi:hypothetical protein
MSTEMKIQESYGSLLNLNTDINDVMEKTRNAWQNIFLSFFKEVILGLAPGDNLDTALTNSNAFGKIFSNALSKANITANEQRQIFGIPAFKADLSQDVDFIDLSPDEISQRITNPTSGDMIPQLMVSPCTLFEYTVNTPESRFPYGAFPIMALHPSARAMYRFNKVYKKYVTDERVFGDQDLLNGAVLEISAKSVIEDITKLLTEYDYETKQFSENGMSMFKEVVMKYTDFALPLIAVNMRVDRDMGESFIRCIYQLFSNNYMGALYFQKRMFELVNTLIQSGVGQSLIKFFGFGKTVTTLDLINPNWKYNTLLHEVLHTTLDVPSVCLYKTHMNIEVIPYANIQTLLEMERDALEKIATRIINLLILGFVVNRTPGKTVYTRDFAELNSILVRNVSDWKRTTSDTDGLSYTCRIMEALRDSLSGNKVNVIMSRMDKIDGVSEHETLPPNKYANDAQMTTQAVYTDEYITGAYRYLGKNAAALEDAQIAKDIKYNGISNAAMREIGTRVQDIQSYEDALGIFLDAASYLDVLKSSTVKTENAETEQFKILLNNTCGKMKEIMDEYKGE